MGARGLRAKIGALEKSGQKISMVFATPSRRPWLYVGLGFALGRIFDACSFPSRETAG